MSEVITSSETVTLLSGTHTMMVREVTSDGARNCLGHNGFLMIQLYKC